MKKKKKKNTNEKKNASWSLTSSSSLSLSRTVILLELRLFLLHADRKKRCCDDTRYTTRVSTMKKKFDPSVVSKEEISTEKY